jgi:hypothetical protein
MIIRWCMGVTGWKVMKQMMTKQAIKIRNRMEEEAGKAMLGEIAKAAHAALVRPALTSDAERRHPSAGRVRMDW